MCIEVTILLSVVSLALFHDYFHIMDGDHSYGTFIEGIVRLSFLCQCLSKTCLNYWNPRTHAPRVIMHPRTCTVVSQVSTYGHLSITCNFGPHGRLPGIKIPYVCIEAATVTL